MKRYKVHVNTRRRQYVYFETMEKAVAFTSEVFEKTGIVLSIVEVRSHGFPGLHEWLAKGNI